MGFLSLREQSSIGVVVAEWRERLPLGSFSLNLPEAARRSVQEVATHRASAALWSVAAGQCVIIDTVTPVTDG